MSTTFNFPSLVPKYIRLGLVAELTSAHIIVLFSTTCYRKIVSTLFMPYKFRFLTICQMLIALFYRQHEISFIPVLFNVKAVTEFLLLGRVYFNFLSLIEYTHSFLS